MVTYPLAPELIWPSMHGHVDEVLGGHTEPSHHGALAALVDQAGQHGVALCLCGDPGNSCTGTPVSQVQPG